MTTIRSSLSTGSGELEQLREGHVVLHLTCSRPHGGGVLVSGVQEADVGDGVGRLTPRELQIALPLADGATVRETAAALFLSPKTVEYHLRHVYTELGISSRPQLREHLHPAAGAR